MKIKRVLISQPEPQSDKSPFSELATRYSLKIDFRPFIHVEGVSAKEVRQQKIDIAAHTGIIFTSRTAIDHYFRVCEEMRFTVPETMKYFCISEAIALYLQKYIVYRKRKIFYGDSTFKDLMSDIVKHKEDKFLLMLSDIHKLDIPKALDKEKIKYTKGIFYRTVSSDVSDIDLSVYDIVVFYSPSGIKSLLTNFPDFSQGELRIGTFGPTVAKAVKDAGLRLDLQAPTPEFPSMATALEVYIKKYNKENGIK
ncbi:uroporphyrinogen-III synthase [Williamwhitmania taraxaci]|uniref:Uroporphyrinogen-III synthase n=1 Tax=Williamwhitmania taraxaci TaxID=1640674 RepID=A0A1G6GY60_9BACT|nr:uroporphyrinogen-III synthase [Williamwhitmania taraxaci]SDB86874.1 uroporphyrinogen-III synthase [Williamwhitmania taraxaci]